MHTKGVISMIAIMIGLILAIPFVEAGEYDLTQCFSGTMTPIISGEKLTIFIFEHKGIVRSNNPDKVFDNYTFHCVGIFRMVGEEIVQIGNCKYQSPDGSTYVGEFTGSQQEGTWKFIYGTGKNEGIQGGGPWKSITGGKPIAPGTFQGCNQAIGTFTLCPCL
jgi:hypothetical protein